MMTELTNEEKINRLVSLSETNPVMPDDYIPWDSELLDSEIYMPDYLFSLNGSSLLGELSKEQIIKLQKFELAQIMAAYAWSETMGCLMFNELLLRVTPTSSEGKYLVKMMVEEFRHQYMFAKIIEKLDVKPEPFSKIHMFMVCFFVKVFSPSAKYLVILAIEQATNMHGKHFRKNQRVFSIIRKACELHHIEEGRHMTFQKMSLEKELNNASFFKRTKLGICYILTLWFMRSQYVKKAFYVNVGIDNPDRFYKEAVNSYKILYDKYCLQDSVDYLKSINLLNFITKPFWKLILKTKLL